MTEEKKEEIAVVEINEEFMKKKLYEFRGCKVLLDADLAEVYGYELKAFNQQVKRNIERFQNDMMFQLSDEEVEYLRSQFVTANISSKSRSNPYVFTEQGVYMLMTVLKGELAVRQSIALVRTFKKIFGETVYAGFYRAYQERRLFSYIKKYNTIMNHSIKKLGKEKGIKYVGN